ncbi:MAG: hypothetical protein HYU37_11355 [Acidobacteria bacterium]|nr:hypothetical protein [Acidobacteriota bacterium]
MTRCILGRTLAAVAVAVSLGSVAVAGQAGRWSLPRLPDGQPDMQGQWISDAVGAAHSVEDGRDPDADVIQGRIGEENPVVIVAPPDNRIPYRPEMAARRQQLLRDIFTPTEVEQVDPHVRTLLDGVPRNGYVPGGMQILQMPGAVLILYESNHAYRYIPLDGRPHAPQSLKLFMGDSRGRWEGNTLVVDVTNFNEETWLDSHGSIHSDALHVVERWTLAGPGRIDYEATLDDPKAFTRPWKIAFRVNRRSEKNYEIFEDSRLEGERAVAPILEVGRKDKAAGITGIHEHKRQRR